MHKRVKLAWLSVVLIAAGAAAQTVTTVTNNNDGITGIVPVYSGAATLAAGNSSPISVSGGNVGIGTTSPVAATLEIVNPLNANGQVGFQVNQATGGNLDLTAAWVKSTDDGNYIRFLHKAITWGAGDYIDANGLFNVKYSGNVGIGITSPSQALDVNGTIQTSGLNQGFAAMTFGDNLATSETRDGSYAPMQTLIHGTGARIRWNLNFGTVLPLAFPWHSTLPAV